jgi:hypothetical protein
LEIGNEFAKKKINKFEKDKLTQPLCPPLKLWRQNRVCGEEAVFDLSVWTGLVFKRNIREGEQSMELDTFTHLSGKYFYSLLTQSVPHSPTDAIELN